MASTEKPLITNRTKPPVHEATHPRPLPGGEHAFVGVLAVPLPGGVSGGFMVPLHGRKAAEAEALYMSVTWFGLAALHAPVQGSRRRCEVPSRPRTCTRQFSRFSRSGWTTSAGGSSGGFEQPLAARRASRGCLRRNAGRR